MGRIGVKRKQQPRQELSQGSNLPEAMAAVILRVMSGFDVSHMGTVGGAVSGAVAVSGLELSMSVEVSGVVALSAGGWALSLPGALSFEGELESLGGAPVSLLPPPSLGVAPESSSSTTRGEVAQDVMASSATKSIAARASGRNFIGPG